MTNFSFNNRSLLIGSKTIEQRAKVIDARENCGLIVVFLDGDEKELRKERFQNIRAYTLDGQLAWDADLPSEHPADAYWSISFGNPIVAMSFSSHKCEIDPKTGKIVRAEFYK